jgi:hypothetical protein
MNGLLFTVVAALSGAGAQGALPEQRTQAEMEHLVRDDLATRLSMAADGARVVESTERTWPDRRLGCPGRPGLEEPVPIPGYAFVLEAAGKRYAYHTDRAGRIVRCSSARKPLAPVSR